MALDTTAVQSLEQLLLDLTEVLKGHPLSSAISVLVTPEGLTVGEDEVIVVESGPSTRDARLLVRAIDDLGPRDLLVDSQVLLDGADVSAGYLGLSSDARPKCLIRYPDGPNKPRHFHT